MASATVENKKQEARRRGAFAVVATVASVTAIAASAPVAGAIGLGVSAALGYRWLRYRIKEGLRF